MCVGGRNFILYISLLGKGALARGADIEFSNFRILFIFISFITKNNETEGLKEMTDDFSLPSTIFFFFFFFCF